jgi:hypothetical protein
MPLVEMQVGDQTIRYDRDATARVYASITTGWAEKCGCVGCRNYLAQRDAVYPPAFRELLNRLDIDSKKDAEVGADGPQQNGLHHYGGWFFFVGEMPMAGENVSELCNSPYFAFWFTRVGPCPKNFGANRILQSSLRLTSNGSYRKAGILIPALLFLARSGPSNDSCLIT